MRSVITGIPGERYRGRHTETLTVEAAKLLLCREIPMRNSYVI